MFSPTISDQLDYSKLISKDIKSSYNGDIIDPTTGRSLLLSLHISMFQKKEKSISLTKEL
jgi:hypothetical protein